MNFKIDFFVAKGADMSLSQCWQIYANLISKTKYFPD